MRTLARRLSVQVQYRCMALDLAGRAFQEDYKEKEKKEGGTRRLFGTWNANSKLHLAETESMTCRTQLVLLHLCVGSTTIHSSISGLMIHTSFSIAHHRFAIFAIRAAPLLLLLKYPYPSI